MADSKVLGGVGVLTGAVATALVMALTDKVMDEKTVQAAIDDLASQGKVAELVEVKDGLALTADSIRPAYTKIYPAVVTRDSTGKVISTTKADTVQIPAGPVLEGFNENGTADYELAVVVPKGSTLRIAYILDGVDVNSQVITPKEAEWVVSARARASLHEGK
jgi:hypothetical protein